MRFEGLAKQSHRWRHEVLTCGLGHPLSSDRHLDGKGPLLTVKEAVGASQGARRPPSTRSASPEDIAFVRISTQAIRVSEADLVAYMGDRRVKVTPSSRVLECRSSTRLDQVPSTSWRYPFF